MKIEPDVSVLSEEAVPGEEELLEEAAPRDEDLRADIWAAKARMMSTFGARRELKKLMTHLWHDELVREMTAGFYGKGMGLVVLTDRRLMFIKDGITKRINEDFPLDKISSAQWSSGLLVGTITVFTSGNKAEIANVNKRDGKRIVDTLRERLSAGSKEAVTIADPVEKAPDGFDQIRKLAELRDAGILTPEEFHSKKTDILGRM